MAEHIVIKELLDYPFSMHPLHNKLRMVNKGRTTPPVINLINLHKCKTGQYIVQDMRGICFSQYEKVDLLAGCETTNRIYCWSCLPFLTNMKQVVNSASRIEILCQERSKNTQSHKLMCIPIYSYNYWENNKGLSCSSTLNAETTSPGITKA